MGGEECQHCGATFDDEEPYLRHLRDEHGDDLGPIEQRRVESLKGDDDDDGPPTAMYAGGVGALALAGLLVYLLFFSGGGASDPTGDGPHAVGSVHYHGTINATVGGEKLDFSQGKFQLQADAFHFENGEGRRWHAHAKGVTLAYAMETLGIDVANGTVSYDGTTYGDDPGETVVVQVNGDSVNASEYVLQKGDTVRIVANESGSA